MYSIPNLVTFFRILLVPVFVVAFYLPFQWGHVLAAVILLVAALSDWFDGFLARTLKQATSFGAFLDPIADKLVVVVALVLLVGEPSLPYIALPAAVIIGREIVVSGLREWMAGLGQNELMAVSGIAKIKTALQMTALVILLAYHSIPEHFVFYIGVALLYIAAVLTLWSMYLYLKIALPEFRNQGKKEKSNL